MTRTGPRGASDSGGRAGREPRTSNDSRRGPSSIDGLIGSFLRANGITSGGSYRRIFDAWNGALDPGLRNHAAPVRFRRGELCVEVDSAAHLQELKNFTGEDYRRRANDRLGTEAIRRVVFKLRA